MPFPPSTRRIEGKLTKLAGGLYYVPMETGFGDTPADDAALVEAFLKDHRWALFVVRSRDEQNKNKGDAGAGDRKKGKEITSDRRFF